VDPAADPWGVRKAENLLTSLEGILSARVVTTPLGEVSEIHILAHGGQNAKQVVRNVESALLAHLGLKVDHRKISVATSADVKPLQALDLGAVRDRAAQRVVLFEDLSLATVPKSRRVTATVTLALGDQTETVTEEGPDTQRNRMETSARAAVMAMQQLFGVQALALEGVQQAEMFGRNVAVVGVLAASARDSRLLMGTAEVRESVEHAAVYAVLDATNRWAVAHRPR
jgi:hypothetical protein